MTNSHTDEVRKQGIRDKFFLDENKLPPPFYKVLVYDDAAKSGKTMDKIVSFLKRNNQDRHVIGLVNSIWACQGYPAPIKLDLN
jgi:predicted amidophosphoribosyltransferase